MAPISRIASARRCSGTHDGISAVPARIRRGIETYSESLLKDGVDWRHVEQRADSLTFTEAGRLPRSRLKSAGTGLAANALESDRNYQRGQGV
jgi:hypothetical protein